MDKVHDILSISGFIKKKILPCMKLYLSNTLSYLWQVVYVAALRSRVTLTWFSDR